MKPKIRTAKLEPSEPCAFSPDRQSRGAAGNTSGVKTRAGELRDSRQEANSDGRKGRIPHKTFVLSFQRYDVVPDNDKLTWVREEGNQENA
jgi:hypothetical protein